MRIITVPETLKIKIGEGPETSQSFKEFLANALDCYLPIGKSVKMLRQATKIIDVIEKSNGTISLEDADYEVVKASMHFEGETGTWNPAFARKVLPYFDAVEKAEKIEK